MKKIYSFYLFILLLILSCNVYSQSHFNPVGDFTNAMNVNILEAKVNGENLVPGDEIGIFDTVRVITSYVENQVNTFRIDTICVGSFVLTQNLLTMLDANIGPAKTGADDTDTEIKDGFGNGNPIFFKMFDTSEGEEILLVVPTYINPVNGNPAAAQTFESGSTCYVSLIATHNYTPVADAGTNQSLNENSFGQLDGSASTDYNGSTLNYLWNDIDNLGLSATNVSKPTFTAPFVNADTQYRVALTVNDGEKYSNADTVIVTVKQVDLPPVANAGADIEIPEGEPGNLDGSASSDPDGLGFTFSWVIEPAEITLDDVNVAKPDFTAPIVTNDKEYLAILTVTNDLLLSDKDTVKIKVINYNLKPVANAGVDVEKNEGENVTLDGSGSVDLDNSPNPDLTFSWTSVEGVLLNNAATGTPDFVTPFLLKDSLLHFVLVVNDDAADSEPDTVVVKVKHKNIPPVANAGADFNANENTLVQLDASTSVDLDGTLSYLWAAEGITISGSDLVNPTFTAPEVHADSTVTFYLTVTDDKMETDKDTVIVTIKHINKKPVSNAGANQEVDENVLITLDGSGSFDPDLNDNITYKWIAPTGITLDNVSAPKPTFTTPSIIEEYVIYIFKLVVNDGTVDSDTSNVVIKLIHLNFAPVSNAGQDFNINENTDGNLDGTNSSDFEGKPLTYSWLAPDGFVINNPDYYFPSFKAPNVERDTTFNIVLIVNDGVRSSLPDTVRVTVNQINKQPIANAGTDRNVDENILVQLDGTASYDLDKYDVITYLWSSLDGAVLNDNTLATPSFTTPWLMKDSIFDFSLIVNDGTVNSIADTVSVSVKHANLKPTAEAGASIIVINENSSSNLNGEGSFDPEGKVLTYLWSAPQGFIIENPNSDVTNFIAPEVEKDTIVKIILTVDDNESVFNTASDTIFVTVVQVNKAPVSNAGDDFSVTEQKEVMLNGSASSDPDALDEITYNWVAPAGIILDDATAEKPSFIAGDVSVETKLVFELTVTDNSLATDKDTIVITVLPNRPPIADAGANQNVRAGETVILHGENSSDPDGDVLTFAWTAPAEITLQNPTSANPTFIAPFSNVEKSYSFTLEVTDYLGSKSTSEIVVTVVSNTPPVIVTELVVQAVEGKTITLDASQSYDPDGDGLSYKWSTYFVNQQDLVSFGDRFSETTTITLPEIEEFTVIKLSLKVTDGLENVYATIQLQISRNQAPVANAGENITVNEGEQFTLNGSASTDPENDEITFLWNVGNISADDVTLETITCTAPEVTKDTVISVVLQVSDGKLSSEPDTVWVTVKNVNKKPVANAGADIVVNEGEMFTLDGSGSFDPDNDKLTFYWDATGLSLPENDSVSLSVTAPEVEEDFTIPVVLVVSDGQLNSAADTVFVQILQINKTPEWVHFPADTAFVGYEYSAAISVSDPDLIDLIYIYSDDLPDWLVLTDNGNATATLSTDSVPRMEDLLGTHTFVIKATDGTITIETTVTLTITVKTGIANEILLSAVKFYPNPTTGLLNVEFNSLPENGTTIQVFNQLGQNVQAKQADSQINILNLSDNPVGLYYIKVISQKASRVEKIILK